MLFRPAQAPQVCDQDLSVECGWPAFDLPERNLFPLFDLKVRVKEGVGEMIRIDAERNGDLLPASACSTRQSRTLRIVFPVPTPPVTPTSTRCCFALAGFWDANASGSNRDSICSRVTSIRTATPEAFSSWASPSSCTMRLTWRDAARRASFPRKIASHRNRERACPHACLKGRSSIRQCEFGKANHIGITSNIAPTATHRQGSKRASWQ